MNVCFKNSTSIVLQQCQNQVSFQRKDSGIVLEVLLVILRDWQCFLFIREHFLSLKNIVKILIRCQSPSLKTYFILILLENNRSAVFEPACMHLAFSMP